MKSSIHRAIPAANRHTAWPSMSVNTVSQQLLISTQKSKQYKIQNEDTQRKKASVNETESLAD